MITLHPGSIRGVVFQSKAPFAWLYAEILGFIWDFCSRFSVTINSGSSRSHQFFGKPWSMPFHIEIKWAFHVCMALLARFCLGSPGYTSWNFKYFCLYVVWTQAVRVSAKRANFRQSVSGYYPNKTGYWLDVCYFAHLSSPWQENIWQSE